MPLGPLILSLAFLNYGAVIPPFLPSLMLFSSPGYGMHAYDAVDWIYPLADFSMPTATDLTSSFTPDACPSHNWWVGGDRDETSFFARSTTR